MSFLDREENLAKKHNIPLGSLVELEDGARLWVVNRSRDCDGTPHYDLAVNPLEPLYDDVDQFFYSARIYHGFLEESLFVVKKGDK